VYTVVGAAAGPILVPVVLILAGFGGAGIAGGTLASSIMAFSGPQVAAGSLCAMLQSAGAAGVSFAVKAFLGAAAGAVVGATAS
jgi:hypothetical protein